MKMGHCLLIFFSFPLLTCMLLLLCEKCASQETLDEFQTTDDSNKFKEHVPKLLGEISTSEKDQIGFTPSEAAATEPFNKSVFVIPITGILLVITMALLYIFYTWNMDCHNETTGGKPREEEEPEPQELSEQIDNLQLSAVPDFHALDSPPSYLEATTTDTASSTPPTYFSIPPALKERRGGGSGIIFVTGNMRFICVPVKT